MPPQGSNLDFPDPESGVLPITPGGNHPSFQRSGRRGSNPRPSAWEADALPTELLPQGPPKIIRRPLSDQSHRSDLNRRPLDYESSALPLSYAGGRWRSQPASCPLWSRLRSALAPPSHLYALARTRTVTPCGTTPSRWRVYQFHHQGKTTGPTGLEPATSRVTVECSNQTELRPPDPASTVVHERNETLMTCY